MFIQCFIPIEKGLTQGAEHEFDTKYTMDTIRLLNGHYSFDGYSKTKIYYDNITQLWKMELLKYPDIQATTQLIPFDYPLGSLFWDVKTPEFKGKLELNLNSCDNFDSFSCMDGACVTIKERFVAEQN